MEERGAITDSSDPFETTALMNCCKRTDKFVTEEVMRNRKAVANILIGKGASFTAENLDGATAMQIACREENHVMALLLAQRGSPIMPLYKWMMGSKANQKNWIAGLVMSKYGWDNNEFEELTKKQFMKIFDRDNSGHLDEAEIKKFIAMQVKMAFENEQVPTKAFTYHPSIGVDEMVQLLDSKAPEIIKGYLRFDKDGDGTYTWKEMLPITRDFYEKMWLAKKPQVLPNYYGNEADIEAEKAAKAKAASAENQAANKAGIKTTGPVLPEGWIAVVDPSTGNTYFANPTTGESSWDIPV